MASTQKNDRWSRKLPRVIRDRDGAAIRSLGEARAYILGLPGPRQQYQSWQCAAQLLMETDDLEAITKQIELALFMDMRLKLEA